MMQLRNLSSKSPLYYGNMNPKRRALFGFHRNEWWYKQMNNNSHHHRMISDFRVLSTKASTMKTSNLSDKSPRNKENEQEIRILRTLLSNVWPGEKSSDSIEQKQQKKKMKHRVLLCSGLMLGGK